MKLFHTIRYYEVLVLKEDWETVSVTNNRDAALKMRKHFRKLRKECEVTTTKVKVPWYVHQAQSDDGEAFQLEVCTVKTNSFMFRGMLKMNRIPKNWRNQFERPIDFMRFIVKTLEQRE